MRSRFWKRSTFTVLLVPFGTTKLQPVPVTGWTSGPFGIYYGEGWPGYTDSRFHRFTLCSVPRRVTIESAPSLLACHKIARSVRP
jgi:hypothetical protein